MMPTHFLGDLWLRARRAELMAEKDPNRRLAIIAQDQFRRDLKRDDSSRKPRR